MKVTGTILIILALVIGIVPQFTDCLAQGRSLTLENGTTVPMKCHWTAQAELALAGPLLILGVLTVINRRKETLRVLSILGIALGVFTILIPTYLIGVCANNMMLCNSVMKSTLILAGTLVAATSVVILVLSRKGELPMAMQGPGQAA